MNMNKILNFADKATKYGFYILLILFALACLFSGCKVDAGHIAPIETDTETTTAEMTCLTPSTTEREETMPEFLDMGEFRLTAYCPCRSCCGIWADGYTATGTIPVQGRTIAVDEDVIPYGSEVIINGHTYVAEDCGGSIIGREIDIYFESHEEANEFGVQYGKVILKLENGGED